jgi:ribulose-phosphate 3-epimerase
MPQLVPAILEKTIEDFLDKVSRVIKLPNLKRIQVDFGDGIFIPDKILPVEEMDTLNPAFHWEAHLMVKEPQDFLDYQICGFKTIIVHYEAYQQAQDLKEAMAKIKGLGMKAGIAINLDTPTSVLKELEGKADQFLIMSVVPGKQGQEFISSSIDKIKELRQIIPRAIIEVDGGVNVSNLKSLVLAGADLICVGSALTKALNMQEVFEQLQREINTK